MFRQRIPNDSAEPSAPSRPTAPSAPSSNNANPPATEASIEEKIRVEVDALQREALATGKRLLEQFPDSGEGQALLGSIYYNFGDMTLAREAWEDAWKKDPRRADACAGLATIASDQGDDERVVQLCREGLTRSTESVELRHKLAEALIALDQPAEAVRELHRAIELAPKDPQSHLLLGQSYALLGDDEKAKSSFEAAIALEPGDQRPYLGLAKACSHLGLEAPAEEALKKFEQLNAAMIEFGHRRNRADTTYSVARTRRSVAQLCRTVADIYIKKRRTAEVEPLLRRAADLDPENARYRKDLALLYLGTRRGPEAVSILEPLVTAHPKEADLHALLADAFAESGRRKEAIAAAESAVKLEPNNVTFQRMLQHLKARK